ncbi:MAG: cation transporter [Planctomycetes bacterium]|nr:cation transporter [Planctomycetota bacterium]
MLLPGPTPARAESTPLTSTRAHWVRIGARCTVFGLVWSITECLVAIWAGELSNSVALLGFGVNAFVETTSAAIILWRLSSERQGAHARTEVVERSAGRFLAGLLLLLAIYLVAESLRRLAGWGPEAGESLAGQILTGLSLVTMPVVFLLKRRVAREIGSRAVRADSVQSFTCFWLAVTTFIGLTLNSWLGWAWSDPLAALLLIPFILKESRAAWKGEACGCGAGHACDLTQGASPP